MGIYEAVDQIVARKAPDWLAQGDTQGFAIGVREKAVQTARALLAMGLSVQQVAFGTGFPSTRCGLCGRAQGQLIRACTVPLGATGV